MYLTPALSGNALTWDNELFPIDSGVNIQYLRSDVDDISANYATISYVDNLSGGSKYLDSSSYDISGSITLTDDDMGEVIYLENSNLSVNMKLDPEKDNHVWLKNISGNSIQINGNGNNIEGLSSQTLDKNNSYHLHYNGLGWYVI